MSETFSLLSTVGALDAAKEMLGVAPTWEPCNDMQRQLLERYPAYLAALPRIPSLECWCKATAQEINALLAARGFDIRLDPWPANSGQFGTLSINDITVLWEREGTLARPIDGHPAFRLAGGGIAVERVAGHAHPVIRAATRGREVVCLTKHRAPGGPFELVAAVERLRSGRRLTGAHYERVVIPMVKLIQTVDVGWMVELATSDARGGHWEVAQAVQEVRLAMNQYGVRDKEATAVGMRRSAMRQPTEYVLDEPFVMWLERPDLDVALCQAYVSDEHWQDPGELDQL